MLTDVDGMLECQHYNPSGSPEDNTPHFVYIEGEDDCNFFGFKAYFRAVDKAKKEAKARTKTALNMLDVRIPGNNPL
jgi:hypothetical protein